MIQKPISPSGWENSNFLGYYATESALNTAYPTAEAGSFAIVGETDTVWIWDTDTTAWVDSGASGTGDVVWPSSSTDNALARFDLATGRLIQNSGILVDDSNNVSEINNLAIAGNFATPYANTITVAKSGGDYTTIQAAMNASTSGDYILVYPWTYSENITTKTGATTNIEWVGNMGSKT